MIKRIMTKIRRSQFNGNGKSDPVALTNSIIELTNKVNELVDEVNQLKKENGHEK